MFCLTNKQREYFCADINSIMNYHVLTRDMIICGDADANGAHVRDHAYEDYVHDSLPKPSILLILGLADED